jgi:hypothetical protein
MNPEEEKFEQEKETLRILKGSGDYRSLLEKYHYSLDTGEGEISPELKLYLSLLITDGLDSVEPILYDPSVRARRYAIEFLRDIGDPKGLLFLAKRLLSEEREDIQTFIKEILCKSERLWEIQDFLLNSIRDVSGKRFELLAEIISFSEDNYFIKTALLRLRNRCPLSHQICTESILPSKSFFVGHRFSKEKIDDLRHHINAAIEKVDKEYVPYYADEELKPNLFCKICKKIQETHFGIYDITAECGNCGAANPNVMLELGMSLVFGKITFMIMRRGSEPPLDLRWAEVIFYDSYSDLEKALHAKLPKALGIR